MDTESRSNLAEHYKEISDEEIKTLLQSGPDSFEKEAYDLLIMESKRRRLGKSGPEVAWTEKTLEEMTRSEILELFLSADNMETHLYNELCAEAFRRNMCRDEVDHLCKNALAIQKNKTNEEETETIDLISNPLPLIIVEDSEDAQPYLDALDDADIPYNIQVIVDERDYEKADHIISHLPSTDD
jgi:hypothetical protein